MYTVNYTQLRLVLKQYARGIKADESLIDSAINLMRVWDDQGVFADERSYKDAVEMLKRNIRVTAYAMAGKRMSQTSTLCWNCKNAVPVTDHLERYVQGCNWSIFHLPVEGWTAEEHLTDGKHTYFVHECPKFVKLDS